MCTYMCGIANAFTLVIDAGHGGRDVGCEGVNTYEKDINLKVAKELGRLIKKKYNDKVKVIYTRDSDKFVELNDRALKANLNDADLFLSIHINSAPKNNKNRQNMKGAMVYVDHPDNSERNLGVIQRRSHAAYIDRYGKNGTMKHNPDWAESQVFFEIEQLSRARRSIDFAKMALKQLNVKADRSPKDIRQGNYQVLWTTMMPAVLVELDYLCNPDIENWLKSKKGYKKCAEALFEAFNKYYKKYK